MPFPQERPRRLRRTTALRDLVRETSLRPRQLVAPLFVKEGLGEPEPISSMPGHSQHTLDSLTKEAREIAATGVRSFIVFAVPATKDSVGSDAVLIGDLCLCEYTDHGHCGVLQDGTVANDATLDLYARTAVAQAEAGADIVAPSGMMDGQVAAIRSALDGASREQTAIMAYSAKFASAHYGPFREAAECAPGEGDRSGYQMDPANAREAVREALFDVAEGADIVMVKPALPYLDVIADIAAEVGVPVAAYNVSGEYAMVQAAALNGWIDGRRVAVEHLTAIARAGASVIVTYHAKELAPVLAEL